MFMYSHQSKQGTFRSLATDKAESEGGTVVVLAQRNGCNGTSAETTVYKRRVFEVNVVPSHHGMQATSVIHRVRKAYPESAAYRTIR
jgi:hypothetical protein